MSDNTPGPWEAHRQSVRGPHGVSVAWCGEATTAGVGFSYHINRTEAEANADLVASAPDLLEALEAMLDDHRRTDPHHEHLCMLCLSASAAISKARGES